jgi:hypothetical protein
MTGHHRTVTGWQITLHSDATVTAISPDRRRVLHSHGPPARVA